MSNSGRRSRPAATRALILVLGAPLAWVTSVAADVVFEFDYVDPDGRGFNAPGALGSARRAALEAAGTYLSRVLSAYDATIEIKVDGSEAGGGFLASAGPNISADIVPGFGNLGDPLTKILRGDAADPDPDAEDAEVSWNFEDIEWSLDNTVGPGEFDFISTAIHELTHAVGWLDGIEPSGRDIDGNAAGAARSSWTPFDRHVGDADGPLIDSDFRLDVNRWRAALEGGSNDSGLFFHGRNAIAANDGNPVNLYSPSPFEPGSSVGHLDDEFFVDLELVMEAASDEGPYARVFSPIELGVLRDLGLTEVPKLPRADPAVLMPIFQLLLE